MGKIVQFCKAAKEINVREDGSVVVSVVGAARLTGVTTDAIRYSLKNGKQKPSKLAKKLIEKGFDVGNLAVMSKEGVTDEALAVIAYYYGHQAGQFCKPEAKRLSKQFDEHGVRATLLQLKGVESDLQKPVKIADEITIREDGVAIVSIRGAARLAGVDKKSLRKHFSGGGLAGEGLAGKLATKGFEGGDLKLFSEQGIPDQALGVILKYYAYEAGAHCTEEAKQTLSFMDDLNVRVWCYSMKGMVEVKQPQAQVDIPDLTPLPSASDELTWTEPTPELSAAPDPKSEMDALKEVFGAAMGMLEGVRIGGTAEQDKNLKTQAAIAAAQSYCPQFAEAFNPVLQLLKQAAATKIVYLTPTTLGQLAGGISAREMNRHLADMGLQVRNQGHAKTEPAWLPTKEGSRYSKILPVTATNGADMTTYQCLRWSEQVLQMFSGGVVA
ncbi:hypothetical protein [Adonisia turfae]|nr:hypothetical protein [Adonisia turfae]